MTLARVTPSYPTDKVVAMLKDYNFGQTRLCSFVFDSETFYAKDCPNGRYIMDTNIKKIYFKKTSRKKENFKSVIGDPGMKAKLPTTAWTGWNFCNGAKGPLKFRSLDLPSPRMADCVIPGSMFKNAISNFDNNLRIGQVSPIKTRDVNVFARMKELYLGKLCSRPFEFDKTSNYSHWSVMFKSGNMDISKGLCVETAGRDVLNTRHVTPASADRDNNHELSFNNLPMNQPIMVHRWTSNDNGWTGGFFAGTYDVNSSWTASEKQQVKDALMDYSEKVVQHRISSTQNYNIMMKDESNIPGPSLIIANSSFLFTAWYQNCSSVTLDNDTTCKWVYFNGLKFSLTYPKPFIP